MAERRQRKIYVAASISGGRDEQPVYKTIVELLKRHGEVLSTHVADAKLTQEGMLLDKLVDRVMERGSLYMSIAHNIHVAKISNC